jgi:DNA end-binding protein Ku
MWKGRVRIGSTAVAVKLYSAAVDKRVHFRLLHAKDKAPVQQSMVDPETGESVPHEAAKRGYRLEDGSYVVLEAEELAAIQPKESRDIEVLRFVPKGSVDPQWFVRPYYLGPDGSAQEHAALLRALEEEEMDAVVRWTMRKKAYVGLLRAEEAAMTLVTLRRTEEMIAVDEVRPAQAAEPNPRERSMAEQLVEMFQGEFDPKEYRDEYRERVLAFVQAKARGKKPPVRKIASRKPEKDLMSALAASLKRGAPRKVA